MDEDARWELALRQKQEADRQADKLMQKELIKNGIAKLKELITKKKGKKSHKKDKKEHKTKKAIRKSDKKHSKRHDRSRSASSEKK